MTFVDLAEHQSNTCSPLRVVMKRNQPSELLRFDESLPAQELRASRRNVLQLAAGVMLGGSGLVAGSARAESRGDGLPEHPAGQTHVLESTKDTVSMGVLDPSRPPALTIDSGDIVHYPNTWTVWGNEARYGLSFEDREPIRKRYPSGPYSNVGPVAVRGAEPGDVLEMRWLRLYPIDWGWNSFPLGVGALPSDFDKPYVHYFRFDAQRRNAPFINGTSIPLAPFQDIAALQPQGDKPISGILAGAYGGNLALPEMVVGTSLLLPVQRSGGLFWTSASVAAQGDGVVDQTGIETAMEDMRIQFVLHKNVPLDGPIVETPTHWIGIGFGDSLDTALVACLRGMIKWTSRNAKLDPRDVYPLCSMAASFRVTQYSDQTGSVYTSVPPRAVHCMLPKSVFSPALRATISQRARST
jgi:acetamidase/formamidase